jgi:hypothetical protein
MMRSYSWGLVFLTARIAIRFLNPTDENGFNAIVWITIGTAWLWPQLIINWKQIFPKRQIQSVPINRIATATGD